MIRKFSFFIILYLLFHSIITLPNLLFVPTKYIRSDSPAGECFQAVRRYMQQSDLVSQDVKNACSNCPHKEPNKECWRCSERMKELEKLVLRLFPVSKRLTKQAIMQTKERFLNGTPTARDFIVAGKVLTNYGEAKYENGVLSESSDEPTQCPPRYIYMGSSRIELPSLSKLDKPFKSTLSEINCLIAEIGKDMQWSAEKIETEQKLLINKLTLLFQNSQKSTGEAKQP